MATGTIAVAHTMVAKGVCSVQWTATGITGLGVAMNAPGLPDKTVQVIGPTGGTTQVVIQGSNDATPTVGNWTTLVDPQGNDLDFTDAAIEAILENPRYIRPNFAVATGPTVTVTILARSAVR